MKERILASLLALSLLLGLLPGAALAAEGEPDIETPVACAGYEADKTCAAEAHVEECPLYEEPAVNQTDDPADVPGEGNNVDGDTTGISPEPEEPSEEQPAVEQLEEMIAALPEYAEVDEDALRGIYAAQSAYDRLSAEERAQLAPGLRTKLEELVELAAEIEEFLTAQAEEGLIGDAVYLANNT